MKKFKKISILFAITAFALLVTSCRKDDDKNDVPTNSYPKQVNITYLVSSTNASSLQLVSYKNETGGVTNIADVAMPFSKTITRTVNKSDDVNVGFSDAISTNVKLEILVNNVSVKTPQNFTGTGAMVYLFP